MAVSVPPEPAPLDPHGIATPEEFVQTLNALRIRSGLTVRELGRLADIPGSTIGGYLSGRHLPPATRPEVLGRLLGALGVPEEEHPDWGDMLHRVHSWRLPKDLTGRRPFLGLRSFGPEDADVFFGRERDVAALRTLVLSSPGAVAVVLGASGSGKSSLVRAGLLPTLPSTWATRVVRPGADPERTLPGALEELAHAGSEAPRRLLVVDQVEELWTLHRGAETELAERRSRVLAALGGAALGPATTVLLCLRSDFYTAAAGEPLLVEALRSRAHLLGPLSVDEIASTITGPAQVFGITLTPGLVDEMTRDARDGTTDRSAVLPHLSHTLDRMWQRSPRRELTVEDYVAVGRIAGALAQTATEAWTGLAPDQRLVARRLLLDLVVVDEGLPPAAGSLAVADLGPEERAVLDRFIDLRLVVVDEDHARFAHEAILTAWSDLAAWIDADRSRLTLRRVVSREARAWDGASRDPDLLLRGARLAAVREWPADRGSPLPALESEFVTASSQAADAQARREQRTLTRTRRLLVATTLFAAAALVAALGLVSSRKAIGTERDLALSREIAAQSRYVAATDPFVAAQLAVDAYGTADTLQARSMVLGATAAPLVTALQGPVGPRMVAAAPGRHLLAVAGQMSTVRLYDTTGQNPRLVAEAAAPAAGTSSSAVYAVAFSPDGRYLALAGTTGRLRILDVATPTHPTAIGPDLELPENGQHARTAYAAAFTPDDGEVLVTTTTGAVLRWSMPTGPGSAPAALAPLATGPDIVTSLAVTSSGTAVVATASGSISTWSLGDRPVRLAATELGASVSWVAVLDGSVYASSHQLKAAYRIPMGPRSLGAPVALAHFGSWANWVEPVPSLGAVAVGSSDHTVVLLTPDGAVLDTTAWPEAVTSIADLGDGRLAIGLVDGQTELRSTPLSTADDPSTGIFFATWSGDGRRLAVFPSSSHNEVRLWDTSSPWHPTLLARLPDPAAEAVPNGSGDISPDGNLVIAGTYSGYLVGWDVTDPAHPTLAFTTRVTQANVEQLRFTDAGHLVLASDDATVRLLELGADGTPTVTETFPGANGPVSNSARSPDGELVAGGSTDGSARLYRVGHAAPVATLDDGGYVYAVAFTPDSRHLLVAGASKVVKVYDIADPAHPRLVQTLHGPTGTIYLVDVSADGQIAAASLDGTVTIWRADGSGSYALGDELLGRTGLYGVDWAPDNTHLVGVGQDRRLAIWTTNPAEARSAVCGATVDPISRDQWSAELPDQPYAPPCPGGSTR